MRKMWACLKEKFGEIWNNNYGLRRKLRFLYQRILRGWDDSETWSLDYTMAKFIIPRLKRFKELNNGFPNGFTSESWDEAIDKMIWSLEQALNNWDPPKEAFDLPSVEFRKIYEEHREKIDEGLELFGKYFYQLWW